MIYYTGQGYLVFVLMIAPLIIIGSILNWGFGIDVLRTPSWWPLHSIVLLGAILTFAIGRYLNRTRLEETVYERSGPVTVSRVRHTLYNLPMEYWGPLSLAIYLAFNAYRAFR